ncbi:MAG: DNA repair protein RecN [Anaerolineales bacterium]
MLTELRIRDFAIIEELDLQFDAGFIVFTGETGAGKSIIIDAVELLLGGRADSTFIRSGAETAFIEGTFKLDPAIQPAVLEMLERESLLDNEYFVLLGREIRREGRNICRINGRTVSLSLLSDVGQWLVDVHGQSEHLSLLRVREHLHLLDRYAQSDHLLDSYTDQFRELQRIRAALEQLRHREQELARKAEFLRFQIDEVAAAQLKPGEDEALREERTRLANAEQLAQWSEEALAGLTGSHGERESAKDAIGRVVDALRALAKVDPGMGELADAAQGLEDQVSELTRSVRGYRESIEFNPHRLDEVEERLSLITSLKRKYGETIEAVLQGAAAAAEELETIEHAEERMAELLASEQARLESLGTLGKELSGLRRAAGERLEKSIESELGDLRMSGAKFGLDINWKKDPDGAPVDGERYALGPSGLDKVEFLVEPNPGEGLKPLARIASGGETSRLMLGMKSVLARADHTPTLIFDEIDQGIGGRVGAIVGKKLWGLTSNHQVLCITHLPQLAAYGDQHFRVEKRLHDERTVTLVTPLGEEERVRELAIMLGGESGPNRESAGELLRTARQEKQPAAG